MLTKGKNFFKSIFKSLLILFSTHSIRREEEKETTEEKLFKVINSILDDQKELLKSQQDERQFFRDWATGFQTTQQVIQQAPKTNNQNRLEDLEYEAQLGNSLAQEIIADEGLLKEYFKLLNDN